MRRVIILRILSAIKLISNNVSVVENFNNKALVTFKVPAIIGETHKQRRLFQKLLAYSTYYSIKPEGSDLIIILTFEWK
jgi:hypothetical protein